MWFAEAMLIVEELLRKREQIIFDADGADDRFYLSEKEWEAIRIIHAACKQEF